MTNEPTDQAEVAQVSDGHSIWARFIVNGAINGTYALCAFIVITYFAPLAILIDSLFHNFLLTVVLCPLVTGMLYTAASYGRLHRRELLELVDGEGTLTSPVRTVPDVARYFTLRLSYFLSVLLYMLASMFYLPLLIVGFGRSQSVLLFPYRFIDRVRAYLGEKVGRFDRFASPRLGQPPKDIGTIDGFLWRTDLWLERRLFPPEQLVRPAYMRFIADAGDDDQPAIGEDDETTGLMEISSVTSESEMPVCQICGEAIEEGLVSCASCDTPHHRECWEWSGLCSIYGCGCADYKSPARIL